MEISKIKRTLSFTKQWLFGAKDSIQWVFPPDGNEIRLIPRKLGLLEYIEHKEQRFQVAIANGKNITRYQDAVANKRRICNHRKGGSWANYIGDLGWGSEFSDYAVVKHQFAWGDYWVRCLRCGKTWKPGDADYEEALRFPTRNTPSSSIQMKYSPDSLKQVRELTKDS